MTLSLKTLQTLCLIMLSMTLEQNTAHAQTHVCGSGPGPGEVMVGQQPAGNGVGPVPLCDWTKGAAPGPTLRDKALWGDPNMAPPPDGKWAAVVSDRNKPLLISINKGFSTRKAAVEAAMEDCRNKGGTRCYLISVVKNG
jgi:hypothetical protein